MIFQNDIMNLKTDIGQKIGQKIIVKGTLGRSKVYEEADVLTRTVEVQVYDGVKYSPLIPPEYEEKFKSKKVV